ncbi:MAG: hypothetical protein ACP5KJ_03355 [Candidatus Micrarchaeia archaeon]
MNEEKNVNLQSPNRQRVRYNWSGKNAPSWNSKACRARIDKE